MINIKSKVELAKMRESGRVVAEALELVGRKAQPGVSTKSLETMVEKLIETRGGKPLFKGYRGFPAAICTSLNEQVVHGIPSERRLQEGEILSVDIGVRKDGYCADAAATFPIGRIPSQAERLLAATKTALSAGISEAKVGNYLFDISHAIQTTVERSGFSVVRQLVGHGIGLEMHEDPQVPNYGRRGHGPRLREGMVLALEPMVNVGSWEVIVLDDDWTIVTKDGSLSAHFEHTVAISSDGPQILTEI